MKGFKNKVLANAAKQSIFDEIIYVLLISMQSMNKNCRESNRRVKNHEEKIRNHLVENYLNNDDFLFQKGVPNLNLRFEPESLENYNNENDIYIGRGDIKVISLNYFTNTQDYFLIECKRLDGNAELNKKFIEDGVCRFVTDPIKYESYHNKNIMIGFIIKEIDINENVMKINKIQSENAYISVNQGFTRIKDYPSNYTYLSKYNLKNGIL